MIQFTEQPIFFERNRVWRVYKGGHLFSELLGDPKEDTNYPEEWVASAVKAMNKESEGPREGLSIIEGTDITFKELIESYTHEMLGGRDNLGILVKYLDSAIRLPMQVHPDPDFSQKYFNSTYGKTEMWLILNTREDASICFGFKDEITPREFAEIIEKSKEDKTIMDAYLNKIPVKQGEVYLIPAKAVHAIGYGCLILEVQEPTDFTIQPEYWCGDYLLNSQEMYMGLSKEDALGCFDYSLYGEKCAGIAKKNPLIIKENNDYTKESLITEKDTPCFKVNRYDIKQKLELTEAPAIYIIAEGKGVLKGSQFTREVRKGEYFFLPWKAKGQYYLEVSEGVKVTLVECLPPDKEIQTS